MKFLIVTALIELVISRRSLKRLQVIVSVSVWKCYVLVIPIFLWILLGVAVEICQNPELVHIGLLRPRLCKKNQVLGLIFRLELRWCFKALCKRSLLVIVLIGVNACIGMLLAIPAPSSDSCRLLDVAFNRIAINNRLLSDSVQCSFTADCWIKSGLVMVKT